MTKYTKERQKGMAKEKTGLVYTNDECIGCNKCISACPILVANKAMEKEGKSVIEVDPNYCIGCGACFDACEHKARSFWDEMEAFFEALKRGEKISLLLAPAFAANDKNKATHLLAYRLILIF